MGPARARESGREDEDVTTKEIEQIVRAQARGCYQAKLLRGSEPWSGAGLQGLAKKYGGHYAQSRDGLVSRIDAALPAGWTATTALVLGAGRRFRRELVITDPSGVQRVWDRGLAYRAGQDAQGRLSVAA